MIATQGIYAMFYIPLLRAFVVTAFVALAASVHAQTSRITFDANVSAGGAVYPFDHAAFETVVEDGYRFVGKPGDPYWFAREGLLFSWAADSLFNADPGGATLVGAAVGKPVTMSRVDFKPFDFHSIGIADLYMQAMGLGTTDVEFLFNKTDGSTVSQIVQVQIDYMQTFVFDQKNLDSVSWRAISGNWGSVQVDDIQVALSSPVPEAPLWALFGAGLFLLTAWPRRANPH